MPYCVPETMATSATTLVSADGALLDAILDATFTIWHEGLSRDAYGRWWQAQLRTAWGRARLRRFALVQGSEVLASAKEYRLRGVLDGRPLEIAGIGAVFAQPLHRGHGHAADLVERLLDRAREDGVGAALLFSEIGPDYYRRLRFDVVPATEYALRVVDRGRGAPATLVRAGDDRDLPAL